MRALQRCAAILVVVLLTLAVPSTMVAALNLDGLGLEYPRGVLTDALPSTPVKIFKVVVGGDSFSSGEGVPNETAPLFEPPSDTNGCHRSQHAYARLLADDPQLNFDLQAFVACSGARTWEVKDGRNGEPSQLNSITSATDVVIITIGGNDAGFEEFLRSCFEPPVASGGEPCSPESTPYNDIMNNISMLHIGLTDIYTDIQAKIGPNTKVLIVGYPFVIKEAVVSANCWLFTPAEQQAATEVALVLGDKIGTTVASLGDNRFRYVDALVEGPFTGHDMCNDADSYFNPWPQDEDVYVAHPDRQGHVAYAQLIKNFWLAIN